MRDRFHSDPMVGSAELLLQERVPRARRARLSARRGGRERALRARAAAAGDPLVRDRRDPGAGDALPVQRALLGHGHQRRRRLLALQRRRRHPLPRRRHARLLGHVLLRARHRQRRGLLGAVQPAPVAPRRLPRGLRAGQGRVPPERRRAGDARRDHGLAGRRRRGAPPDHHQPRSAAARSRGHLLLRDRARRPRRRPGAQVVLEPVRRDRVAARDRRGAVHASSPRAPTSRACGDCTWSPASEPDVRDVVRDRPCGVPRQAARGRRSGRAGEARSCSAGRSDRCSIRAARFGAPSYVPAGESVRLVFATGVADSRDAALRLTEKYSDVRSAQRAIDLAWTAAQLELRDLGISPQEAITLERLASRLVLTDPYSPLKVKTPVENGLQMSGLWSIGISGDLPILLVRVEDLEHAPLVRQALLAHQYWRHKGLVADLVILNTRPTGYADELDDRLRLLVRTGHALQLLDKPGGVFLRRADQMHPDVLNLLRSVARATLEGDGGSHRAAAQPPRQAPARRPTPWSSRARRSARLLPASRVRAPESALRQRLRRLRPRAPATTSSCSRATTPRPRRGSTCWRRRSSAARSPRPASGCTWALNSHENRITTWNNDPVSRRQRRGDLRPRRGDRRVLESHAAARAHARALRHPPRQGPRPLRARDARHRSRTRLVRPRRRPRARLPLAPHQPQRPSRGRSR